MALEAVADEQLIERAVEIGRLIAANDADAVAAAKETMRAWRLPLVEAAESIENAAFARLLGR